VAQNSSTGLAAGAAGGAGCQPATGLAAGATSWRRLSACTLQAWWPALRLH